MVQRVNSGAFTERIRDLAKLQGGNAPNTLLDNIQPVLVGNPIPHLTIKHALNVNATSTTIHTTSSTNRTFLVGGSLSYIKDATSTSTFVTITGQPKDGTTPRFLILPGITLTASNGSTHGYFGPNGIELAKGTTITVTSSTATANVSVAGSVWFYEVES